MYENAVKMNIADTILETRQGSIKVVKYNKPNRKNAIDVDMYLRVTRILREAGDDDDVSVMVLTGTGDYYSSGNDIKSIVENPKNDNFLTVLKEYIDAFITFPKLLVAIVNGPAIGIAATTLGLCDLVFAAEDSFFYTPFTKLGVVAEGCSTFTFPRLIGDRKAAEMLLYNHKMSAKEALECGFVNDIYKPDELQNKVWEKIVQVSKLPKQSISATKKLLRGKLRDEMRRTNEQEIQELSNLWNSEEKMNSVQDFLNRKSKL